MQSRRLRIVFLSLLTAPLGFATISTTNYTEYVNLRISNDFYRYVCVLLVPAPYTRIGYMS